jgi:CheY-like chemotaxis protein
MEIGRCETGINLKLCLTIGEGRNEMTKPLALIIEDDRKLADIFSITLRGDFEIEVIGDGEMALTRLAEVAPFLVVLDIHLPQVSGLDILRYIRSDSRLAGTRVIVATADGLRGIDLKGMADLILFKPISPSQLLNLAQRLRPA